MLAVLRSIINIIVIVNVTIMFRISTQYYYTNTHIVK